MDPRRDSRSIGPGEAEGGGVKLRETSPRRPTPGLAGPERETLRLQLFGAAAVTISAAGKRPRGRWGCGWAVDLYARVKGFH